MSIATYSLVLTLGVLALGAGVILSMIAYSISPRLRQQLERIPLQYYFFVLAGFTLVSVIGAAMYQYVYELFPCEYCWWQRVFIVPIFFVALFSGIKNIRENTIIITTLALFWLFFAGYQLYVQYQQLFFQKSIFTTCSAGGLFPSCSDTGGVEVFGFVTIPFMAVVFLISALWINYLARRARAS